MTTTVKVEAHCKDTLEVHVDVSDGSGLIEQKILQNGETCEVYAYDDQEIKVRESEK